MRRIFLIISLLLIACSDVPQLPKLSQNAVILAFGDSLTFGSGASQDESYPAQLEKRIGRKVISSGVPGEVSAEGLLRLPEVLDETKPQLMILCHGGNDLLRKLGEKETADNLRAMVRLAKERGIAVLLIGVPRPSIVPETAEFYSVVAQEFKLPIEVNIVKTILTDRALKADPIHPNANGYTKFAEAIADLLKKTGAI